MKNSEERDQLEACLSSLPVCTSQKRIEQQLRSLINDVLQIKKTVKD